jgi:hypothetical protein
VLREPWHLSYPFVWQDTGGKLLMVPESVAARQVALYESDSPLGPWQLRSVLLQGRRWADSTLMPYGGRWWLFASSAAERGCPHDELWAYHADRIDGPWRGHALNPLKIDARSARPAGAMGIDADGFPYRVAQDCSTVYGGAVRLMRIVALDPERYEEEEVEPGNAFRTTRPWHTLNADDHGVVIDTLRRRSRWGGRGAKADRAAAEPTQNGSAATGQF